MKTAEMKVPGAVAGGLAAAIALDTFVQIAWKRAGAGVPVQASFARIIAAAGASPWFYAAMVAFAGQFFNWLRVLRRADLSFAQPFTALSYVSVLTISGYSLHETISAAKLGGAALIALGVCFISRTPVRTGEGATA